MKFRVGKFAIVGIALALFNFLVYELLARLVFQTNELLWLDSIIAYALATILAFILHSKITWRERHVTAHSIAMFFLWNGITAFIITPVFTWFFSHLGFVYTWAHGISTSLGLPFDYEFVESTGVFGFTTCITMILNYFFYDKLVFDDTYLQNLLSKVKSKLQKPTKSQVIAFLLYLLPVIFAVTTTFLITTSGEDNFQGAGNHANGTAVNVVTDAVNAFKYNSRLTDMYAWSVIDFYDYQFIGGIDFIFRLFDAFLIITVFYLATYLILDHKPKLVVKDALVFCVTFSVFIITPFGRAFYHEFSMIHNYVPLAIFTLLMFLPYIKYLTNKNQSSHPLLRTFFMLILGTIFGMSATITPLAFLAAIILSTLIRHKTLKKPPLWFFSGLLGTVVGFLICWLMGSGVDHYTNPATAATFDYLPLSDIFSNLPKLAFHEFYNFSLTLLPLLAVFVLCLFFVKHKKSLFSRANLTRLFPTTINFTLFLTFFVFIHILGASLVKSPPRLLIPAYLAGLILIFRLFLPHLSISTLLTSVIVFFTTIIVVTHLVLLLKYHSEMSLVLSDIKSSSETTLCISPESTKPTRIKLLDLAQANMLVDWGVPEPIYQRGIINCE